MHTLAFIQDLAIIMMVAGIVTVIFHRLKQPVVLGYILAGLIIGPYTPPFPLISDKETIAIFSELGIIFLMFSLGLEFNLAKLRAVGATAFIAAITEIVVMAVLGYQIGMYFDWRTMDAIFLGAMLAMSSTTIIIKALEDLNMKRERFAQLMFGILIVEDVLAIGIMALLSGIAATGSVSTMEAAATIAKLSLFMVVALVLGILLVPRLLKYVAAFKRDEVLLITVLALCFGFCLLVIKLDYSVALGAFMIGAIMAESRQIKSIEKLIAPVRYMFSAVFFVTIGLLLNPDTIIEYAKPILFVTVAVVLGKIVSCSLGALAAGNDGKTSLRVGMGLAQIGEFSFIIATLGLSLGVISHFLYPIVVATSVITTLLTPYLIKAADPLSIYLTRNTPARVTRFFQLYTTWLQSAQPQGDRALLAGLYRKMLMQIFVNLCLVSAIFIGGSQLIGSSRFSLPEWVSAQEWQKSIVWGIALVMAAPFLIAVFRKVQALGLLLADHGTQGMQKEDAEKARRFISRGVLVTAVIAIAILITALSYNILPPIEFALAVLVVAGLLVMLMWRWFVRMHYRMQITLIETMNQNKDEH